MSPNHPKLGLAQAIITVIAEKTGREVRGADIQSFSDFLCVTVAFAEDGALEVTLSDPLYPSGAPSAEGAD